MNTELYINNINDIKRLENEVRNLNNLIDMLKEELKQDMIKNNVEVVDTEAGVVRYTDIVSNRFDSAAFKKAAPELYKNFVVESISKRFTIK